MERQAAALRVGFDRVDITPSPNVGVLLAGYENRWSEGVLNEIMATCVCITDDWENTLLLYTLDMCNTEKHTAQALREKLNAAVGIPGDNITICGTHTHASPREPYADNYVDLLVQAGLKALEDRVPAVAETGSHDVPDMNFDRHYVMNDGSMRGDNFGDPSIGYREHASVADPTMRLIRFRREEKQDIVMVNWQAHPSKDGSSSSYLITADFVASVRDTFEKTTGEHFIYFTGTAGNQNPSSRLASECVSANSLRYGQLLAEAVIKLLEDMQTPAVTALKTAHKVYTGQVNHDNEDKLEQAKKVVQAYEEESVAAAKELAEEYGFVFYRQATYIVKRSTMGTTRDMELSAATLGGVSFVTAPYEMFTAHGTYIKEHSPADMTFVITCCNGNNGYLPTNKAYDYNSYEGYSTNFARGTGDEVAEILVQMLESIR